LEELIDKINDILDNRVDANLKVVSRTMLIDLPSDRSFSFEDFVETQTKFIKKASGSLGIKNHEVERAVSELVDMVRHHPRENNELPISDHAVQEFTRHHEKLMYQVYTQLGPQTRVLCACPYYVLCTMCLPVHYVLCASYMDMIVFQILCLNLYEIYVVCSIFRHVFYHNR
jgi:hypothetical protein